MRTIVRIVIAAFAAALIVLSCATNDGRFRIEPDAKYTKLLIGSISYHAEGWGFSIDGTFYDGLSIKLRNVATNEVFLIQQTPGEKFFYMSGLPVGRYQLVNIVYKNNGGNLNWDITNDYRLTAESDNGETRTLFEQKFPNSAWLQMDWRDQDIN
jgi:hypothetical protein